MNATIHQFPERKSSDDDEWLFDLRIVRMPNGRAVAYLIDVRPAEFETAESVSARLRRIGIIALEASANLLAVADNLSETP